MSKAGFQIRETGGDLTRIFERLGELPDEASRLRFVSRLKLLSPSTVERLDEAVATLVRKDLKKAQILAELALAMANQLGGPEPLAYASRAIGNALWFLGQNSQAAENNRRAVELFQQADKRVEAARTLSTSIQPLILLGEYERARAAAEQAARIFAEYGEHVRLARLKINLGNIFHRQDKFEEALKHYRQAYSELAGKDVEGTVAALHNIAVCLIALNEGDEALQAYREARQICQEKDLPLPMAQADYNIAYLFFLKGEYSRAIDLLRSAQEISRKAGDVYHMALCQLDLSEIYLQLNLNQDSAELAQEAHKRFEQLGMGYETAKALCQSAVALSQQNKNFHALMLFAQARLIFTAEKNHVWPSLIDLYQAFAYFHEGYLAESRRYCAAALDFFRDSALPGRAILCHLLMARLSLKAGDMRAARHDCQTAIHKLTGRETPVLVYQAHLVMGQIEETTGNLSEAEKHYSMAREVLERLRMGIRGEELKISFLENKLEVFESLVRLCLARGGNEEARKEAWSYMEQAKSRNLLEMIVRAPHRGALTSQQQAPMVDRILKLREQLNWYYHRLETEQVAATPAPEEKLLELQQLASQSEKEFLQLLRELPAEEAEAVGLEEARPASLESVREALSPDATLVEYFRVQDRILAVLISQNEIETVYLTTAPRVAEILGMLQQQFSQFRLSPAHIGQFIEPLLAATRARLHGLYLELLGPVREKLKGGHLLIVPHESLHAVPFHALFDGQNYLIDSFTVSYAPSASIYVQCHRKTANQTGPALLLGSTSERAPYIAQELAAIAEIIPEARRIIDPEASEKALREHGPESRMLHIASHGSFREDRPMFSGIWLGNTFLTLYDLYTLNLPVEHITLSGCSTGLNAIASGDEVFGMMRGLLFAGARRLLLTLWDVNDRSTAEFMKLFYSYLQKSGQAAVALQTAMQELRKQYQHPYYWAPFMLVGKVSN